MEKSQNKFHVKKGDTVYVIAGSEKGKTGKILRVMPSENKAVVEKLNMVKRHTKASAKNPSAGIVEKEAGIHISNLMIYDSKTRKPVRGKARGADK